MDKTAFYKIHLIYLEASPQKPGKMNDWLNHAKIIRFSICRVLCLFLQKPLFRANAIIEVH